MDDFKEVSYSRKGRKRTFKAEAQKKNREAIHFDTRKKYRSKYFSAII